MKPSQHTTSAQVGPTLGEISAWHERLRELHARLRPHFVRPEVHQHALGYLQAVLSDVPRKNGWQIAEHARCARPYGMQRLLSAAAWDQDAVRDDQLERAAALAGGASRRGALPRPGAR